MCANLRLIRTATSRVRDEQNTDNFTPRASTPHSKTHQQQQLEDNMTGVGIEDGLALLAAKDGSDVLMRMVVNLNKSKGKGTVDMCAERI